MPRRRIINRRKYGRIPYGRRRGGQMLAYAPGKGYILSRPRYRYRIPVAPVPNKMLVKLRYADSVEINPGSLGAIAYHTMRANDLYDPDFTGTGHQPKGFDQWTAFYDHFTVLGSKIRVTFTSMDDTPSTGTVACGIYLDDNSTPPNNVIDFMEERKNTYMTLGSADSGNSSKVMTRKFSSKKFFGVKNIVGQSLYRGQMGNFGTGSSPTEQAYWQIWATGLNATSDVSGIRVLIDIEYIAVLTERKELTLS